MKLKLIARIVTANNEPQLPSTRSESLTDTFVDNRTREQRRLDSNERKKQRRRLYNQRWYEKQKALKRCVNCNQPAVEGKTKCQDHINKVKLRDLKRIERGQCLKCDERSLEGHVHCQNHLDVKTERGQQVRDERKEQELCVYCGKRPPVEGGVLCQQHLEYNNQITKTLYNQRKKEKKCTRCGEPAVEGKSMCQKHLDNQKKYNNKS